MQRRKTTGIIIFVLCIVTFFIDAYLLMLSVWSPVVLQLTVLMITGGLLGVIAWIGYMMATTKSISSFISDDDGK